MVRFHIVRSVFTETLEDSLACFFSEFLYEPIHALSYSTFSKLEVSSVLVSWFKVPVFPGVLFFAATPIPIAISASTISIAIIPADPLFMNIVYTSPIVVSIFSYPICKREVWVFRSVSQADGPRGGAAAGAADSDPQQPTP